ncbi:MAG: TonB family protein [Terriglobia bacterium]
MTRGMRALALFTAFLALACVARAQTESTEARPVTLDRKAATGLILAQTKPEYPPLAKVNYIQGKVRMQVLVSSEGKVTEANVVQGHPFLAAAALKAVRRWLYAPFKTARGPVAFVTLVDVNFALRNLKQDQIPPEAEEYLRRQVRPPSMVTPLAPHAALKRVQVLVSDDGRALDVKPIEGFPYQYGAALRLVEQCQFQPAHWGPLAVPWYLDIDVPVEEQPALKEALLGR